MTSPTDLLHEANAALLERGELLLLLDQNPQAGGEHDESADDENQHRHGQARDLQIAKPRDLRGGVVGQCDGDARGPSRHAPRVRDGPAAILQTRRARAMR